MKNIQVELEKSENAVAGFSMPASARIVGIEIPHNYWISDFPIQRNENPEKQRNNQNHLPCHNAPSPSFIIIL